MKKYFKQLNENLSFTDGVLMLIAFIFSNNLYKDEGSLAVFYGWFFATGILFAIKLSFKEKTTENDDKKEEI